jgi:hypothetical protein
MARRNAFVRDRAFIPLGDVTAISFVNPIFAIVLAIQLLRERVGPWRWAAAALAFASATILLRLGDRVIHTFAVVALAAAAIMGVEIILIKRLRGREHPLQILVINNDWGLHRNPCHSAVLGPADTWFIGRARGNPCIDGLHARLLRECDSWGRSQPCCAVQLCDSPICHAL